MVYQPYMGYNMKKWASERLVLKYIYIYLKMLYNPFHCTSMKKYDSLAGKKLREVSISRFADIIPI